MKILVLYVNGMVQLPGFSVDNVEAKLKEYLELQFTAETTITLIQPDASTVPYDKIVTQLAQCIAEQSADYDGFVVIQAIEQVEYSATLLSYCFTSLGKPIVFTGAGKEYFANESPELYEEVGLRTNLMTAIQIATLNCRGVFLAYGSNIIRAERAVHFPSEMQWFMSGGEEFIAQVQFGIELQPGVAPRLTHSLQLDTRYSTEVLLWQATPHQLLPVHTIMQQYQAVIIYGASLPVLQPQLYEYSMGLPLIVVADDPANVMQDLNISEDVYIVPPITPACILAKTMVGLGRYTTSDQLRAWFTNDDHQEYILV